MNKHRCTTRSSIKKISRQKRPAISDDYLVYLHESKIELGIDNDLVSFSQDIESNNSDRWINARKDELKYMEQNEVWTLLNHLKVAKQLGVNESLKLNVIQLTTLNFTRLDLLQKVSLNKMTSTTKKYFNYL